MKLSKKLLLIATAFILLVALITVCFYLVMQNKSRKIDNDYSSVFSDEKYEQAVLVKDIEAITQSVSCGYAVIEMFSSWCGDNITEDLLYKQYNRVVTSTGKGFCEEMNKQFPQYITTGFSYLSNTDLLDKIYDSLFVGIPVPVEWAALYEDEWTLHYSLVTGMDVKNDVITVANPYGYTEQLSVKSFLERTTFKAYENMPLFLNLGFAFGLFEKNTIYIAVPQATE